MLKKRYPGAHDAAALYPRELTDTDVTRVTLWLQRQYIKASSELTLEAVQEIAERAAYHPVRDYLRKLQWDGVPRCDTWLINYFGAEDTAFNRAVGSRWMIAGVARVMQPGCRVRNVPVLEGPQDMRKSSASEFMQRDEWNSPITLATRGKKTHWKKRKASGLLSSPSSQTCDMQRPAH